MDVGSADRRRTSGWIGVREELVNRCQVGRQASDEQKNGTGRWTLYNICIPIDVI